jgi:hypothetical protein
MNTKQKIVAEKVARIKTTVSLEKPDRTPVVLLGDTFCARHLGIKMSEFSTNPEFATQTMIKSLTSLGDFDGVEFLTADANLMSLVWLSDVKIPGRELPDDVPYQLDETGTMTVEDYDTIINKGFQVVAGDILVNRLRDKDIMSKIQHLIEFMPHAAAAWVNAGIVPFCPVVVNPPFEVLTGARSMSGFTKDLFRMPDKVEAAMKVIQAENIAAVREQIRMVKPLAVFIGLARAASEFNSPKISQRFVWPYIKEFVEMIVEEGAFAYLHCDANWERDLDYFRELPKGKCVVSSDSATSIYKMKEKLGDHICLMGDVPPALLTLGTPDEVYKHCTKIINEIGPTGYILSQSCTIPTNAKPENIAALISAATGK